MQLSDIFLKVDHTLLTQSAKFDEIKTLCDEGIKYHTASVCIPPCFVKDVKDYVEDKIKICTVIGFPNGYQTTNVKQYETKDALLNGADEIDMVINIGDLKSENYDKVLNEIKSIKEICQDKILKVIIETCLLTKEEKIKMCGIVSLSGADFIKTSTGFSTGGATKEDIILFKKYIDKKVLIKAAGGISSLKDAEDLINLGCQRIGTSKIIKLAKNKKGEMKL